jgi:hypothetical protein
MAARALWASGGTLTASLAQRARIGARLGGAGALAVGLRQRTAAKARLGGSGALLADAAVLKHLQPTGALSGHPPDPLRITAAGSGPLTITGHR